MSIVAYTLVPYLAVLSLEILPTQMAGNTLNILSVFALLSVVAFVTFEAYVRRLHDLGKNGWFCLLSIVPIVGFIFLGVLLLIQGEEGPNKYGPPPR